MGKRQWRQRAALFLVLFACLVSVTFVPTAHAVVRPNTDAPKHATLPSSLHGATGDVGVIIQLQGQSLAETYGESVDNGRKMNANAQSIIVTAMSAQQAQVESQLKPLGAKVFARYTNIMNGLWLHMPAANLAALENMPQIRAIYPEELRHIENGPSVQYIKATDFWATGGATPFKGQGVKVGIIDTGIDYTHALLGGSGDVNDYKTSIGVDKKADQGQGGTVNAATCAAITVPHFPNSKVVGGIDLVGYDYDATPGSGHQTPIPDCNPMGDGDHGTHVAGTVAGLEGTVVKDPFGREVYGVAPQASLYAIKVFGAGSSNNTNAVVALGIEYALDPVNFGTGTRDLSNHLNVINLSLGQDLGNPYDLDSVAIAAAAKAGVIPVIAAGNDGQSVPYVIGNPGASPDAITVAAAIDDAQDTLNRTIIVNGTSYQTVSDTSTSVSSDVVGSLALIDDGTGIDPSDACEPLTSASKTAIFGKIAVVKRGNCSVYSKVWRVFGQDDGTPGNGSNSTGILGVIVTTNTSAPFDIGTGAPAPVVMTSTKTDSDAILAALGAGPVVGTITTQTSLSSNSAIAGTLANFTSNGPGRVPGTFKPDVAAPGVNIYSSLLGSGTGTVSFSGTSMATPHVAGSVALLIQAHPTWKLAEIKAALMDTARPAKVSANDPSINPFTLQGAGIIDVLAAGTTKTVAYTSTGQGGIGFGNVEIANGTATRKMVMTVENMEANDKTYALTSAFVYGGGAGMKLSFPASLKVKAGKKATFTVTATFTASLLTFDASRFTEYDGQINLNDGSATIKIPFQAIPIDEALVSGKSSRATVTLTDKSKNVDGPASFFTLGATAKPVKSKLVNTPNNIVSVGTRTNPAYVPDPANPTPPVKAFEFAIATNTPWFNPSEAEFDLPISLSGYTAKPDFLISVIDKEALAEPVGSHPTGITEVIVEDMATATVLYNKDINVAFNSNVLTFSIPVSALNLTDFQTLTYYVAALQPYYDYPADTGLHSKTGDVTFDPSKEVIIKSGADRVLDVVVPKGSSSSFTASGSGKLMAVYPANPSGKVCVQDISFTPSPR